MRRVLAVYHEGMITRSEARRAVEILKVDEKWPDPVAEIRFENPASAAANSSHEDWQEAEIQ